MPQHCAWSPTRVRIPTKSTVKVGFVWECRTPSLKVGITNHKNILNGSVFIPLVVNDPIYNAPDNAEKMQTLDLIIEDSNVTY